jgi:hypothetical protein
MNIDPDKLLSLLERAGALGVLAGFIVLQFKGMLVIGQFYNDMKAERDDWKQKFLDKVDPPADKKP